MAFRFQIEMRDLLIARILIVLWCVIDFALLLGGEGRAEGVVTSVYHGEKFVCHAASSPLEPYVPDPETAKAIFLAVESARVPNTDKRRFPLVDVLERGGRWIVFRHNGGVDGEQLELQISKCTGRIYRGHVFK